MNSTVATDGLWFLERLTEAGTARERVRIVPTQFLVGRRRGSGLMLLDDNISKTHAEIHWRSNRPWIRDLGSTNGTFLNGNRVDHDVVLEDLDIVHFADVEFRVRFEPLGDGNVYDKATDLAAPSKRLEQISQFHRLFDEAGVLPYFQPIVAFANGVRFGYELLGRARLIGLPNHPLELFQIAAHVGMETQLSELFRAEGVRAAERLPHGSVLFMNTHPSEVCHEKLLTSLRDCRERFPAQPLVLEIHESSVTDWGQARELKAALKDLNIGLAYDDFGAGQARLIELVEVPPDYLKFDKEFVKGIAHATAAKQRLVASLVAMAKQLEVTTVAEGIEELEDSLHCGEMGFDFAQGYFYGRPAPAADFQHR